MKTVPAGGVLTLNGAPLEFYQVTCFPEGDRPAVGTTDIDGRFSLGPNEIGDGAVPGKHKVSVTYVGPPSKNPEEGITEFSAPPAPKQKVHKKYFVPEISGLTMTIPF